MSTPAPMAFEGVALLRKPAPELPRRHPYNMNVVDLAGNMSVGGPGIVSIAAAAEYAARLGKNSPYP
ncbi:MAG TPA: hypothetical protein VJ770_18430 [Stellaceae bacterium]|nr:hypothetical protein [Stellaceae bacterium]